MLEENLRLRANGRNNSQHCCANNVGSCWPTMLCPFAPGVTPLNLSTKILTQAKSHIPPLKSQLVGRSVTLWVKKARFFGDILKNVSFVNCLFSTVSSLCWMRSRTRRILRENASSLVYSELSEHCY